MHLLQQTEPFPDKPGGDRLAGWLSAQHLASRFADASPERVIAEADLRLRPVAVPRLADDLRQAVLAVIPAMPAVSAERVIVPLFTHQVIAVVVIPAAKPAARRRTLGIAGKDVPAMQAAKTFVFAAGGQQPLGAAVLTEELVAGILTAY
ncbi:hypothetical protein SS08_06235 [Enterobacter hormaechei subsp. steigerwaltii]|nr:hypothetical protein LI62_14450 [Enterobacter hormaechei subsp. steigerwaltii]KJO32005.1 hypothetical protein SS08_06235 [Enterobacter hormaechei subsp. steigerwaltii]